MGDTIIICGGNNNEASGQNAVACGGQGNKAIGTDSFACGYYAEAIHERSFVWAGRNINQPYSSHDHGTFNINAYNGFYFEGGTIHDVAEYMDVLRNEKTEEGDIVSIREPAKLGKSSGAYDENIIGVISGRRTCSFYMGDDTPKFDDTERLPIALVGQVYIKVNSENGPIKPGDPITSSSTPGIGMKSTRAGKIVGYAMEEFSSEAEGEILVFVNLSYYVPPTEYLDLKTRLEALEEQVAGLK